MKIRIFRHHFRTTRVLLAVGMAGVSGLLLWRLQALSAAADTEPGSLLQQLSAGADAEQSIGYDYGAVRSLDGKQIAAEYTSSGGYSKLCGLPGYHGVLGATGSCGALNQWRDVLRSASDAANRRARTGNTIVTTLHSVAQETAAQYLSTMFPPSVCDGAAVAVVLRDGAVLAAAGNTVCAPQDYFSSTAADALLQNTAFTPYKTGSVAKVIMARALERSDVLLPPEWSVYADFDDVSEVTLPGSVTIHNHDRSDSSQYDRRGQNGEYRRTVDLCGAAVHSSNTYFVRHMYMLGGGDPAAAYAQTDRLFGLSTAMQTDTFLLPAISCSDPARLPYWFFGQDFETSPVRLCQLCNHVFSGEACLPFLVSSVLLPDGGVLYEADPQPRAELGFDVAQDDLLYDVFEECLRSYVSEALIAPYTAKYRLMGKTGTADTVTGKTNAVRVLTVAERESGRVLATAAIFVLNKPNGYGTNDDYFGILLETLRAAGVITPG